MKRTVLVKTTGIGRTNPLADPVMVPISLIREPWHQDTPPRRTSAPDRAADVCTPRHVRRIWSNAT
jgi:hypothetical protein